MGFMSGLKDKVSKTISDTKSLKASEEVAAQRIAICNSCEFLLLTRNCRKCGCFVDLKTHFANERCPVNKW